jgi:hypothetical protein
MAILEEKLMRTAGLTRALLLTFTALAGFGLNQTMAQVPAADAAGAQPIATDYREQVSNVIQANFLRLRECFEEAIARNDSAIPTKLPTLFRIGRFGNVQSIEFEEETEISSELSKCLIGRISYLRFPSRESEAENNPSRRVRLILNFSMPQPEEKSDTTKQN